MPLEFEPGEGQRYSNAGSIVLGAIVEAASGMDYVHYIEENIFVPARMTRSGFPIRDGSKADIAIGYTTGEMLGEEPGELRPNIGMLPIRGCPAGSSSHTAEDLLKFDRARRAALARHRPDRAMEFVGRGIECVEVDDMASWRFGRESLGTLRGGEVLHQGAESGSDVLADLLPRSDRHRGGRTNGVGPLDSVR